MVRVRPARRRRAEFAQYAVSHAGRAARTLSESEFSIPDSVYVHMPERLLVGATVEGHPYVPVADEPVAVPGPEGEAPAPEPVDDPANADYGYAHGSLDAPVAEPVVVSEKSGVDCPVCGRHMINQKGLDTHMRRAHSDESEES